MTNKTARQITLEKQDEEYKKNLVPIDEFIARRERAFVSLWARTGVGKSRFILGAPKPIWFLSYEIEGPYWAIRNAYQEGLLEVDDVLVDEVIKNALDSDDIPAVRTTEQEADIWDYTKDAVESICRIARREKLSGTIAIDTQSSLTSTVQEVEMEDIIKKREAQGKDEPYQFDFGRPNKAFKRLFDHIRQTTGLNLIVTAHSKPVYNAKGADTGRVEYSGSSRLREWVDVHGELWYEEPRRDNKDKIIKASESGFIVEKCRIDRQKVGLDVIDPTFGSVMRAINGNQI